MKTTFRNVATTAQNIIFDTTSLQRNSDDNYEVVEEKEDNIDVESV